MQTLYIVDNLGIYTGQTIEKSEQEGRKSNELPITPPALSDGEYAQWDGFSWVVLGGYPEPPVIVPVRVTMRQFQLALIETGHYDAVEAFIETLTGVEKKKALVEWRGAFAERASPSIAVYGASLGMTEEDIDNLFILADTK